MLTILIADDENDERNGVSFLLDELGYKMNKLFATNGKNALESLKCNHIDILFTDIRMPIMDGLELTKEAKKINPNLKIIIYSGFSEFEYAKKAIELGVSSYILKPVNIDEFKQVFDKVINEISIFTSFYKDIAANLNNIQKPMLNEAINKLCSSNSIKDISKIIKSNANDLNHSYSSHKKTTCHEIDIIKKYIESHYAEDLDLINLSEKVYLSPKYLSDLFRKVTGCGINKYIKTIRMNKAKELLENTNIKIIDICTAVGFHNLSYFCQTFREFYGNTPEKYRQQDLYNNKWGDF